MTTIVRYFVPEDRDSEEKPNAFVIYKPIDELRLKDIKEYFPLPGDYHFRFKFELSKPKKSVWLDFNKEESKLPTIDGKILIKVSRLSWNKQEESTSSNSNNVFSEFI